jgi:hypothetical protein
LKKQLPNQGKNSAKIQILVFSNRDISICLPNLNDKKNAQVLQK